MRPSGQGHRTGHVAPNLPRPASSVPVDLNSRLLNSRWSSALPPGHPYEAPDRVPEEPGPSREPTPAPGYRRGRQTRRFRRRATSRSNRSTLYSSPLYDTITLRS